MVITVFSLNKYKSTYIKNKEPIAAILNPHMWAIMSDGCEVVRGGVRAKDGHTYSTCNSWNTKVDIKYW